MVRNITGYGQGKGPYISFHDGSSSDIISPFAPVMETSPIVVCVVIFVILAGDLDRFPRNRFMGWLHERG